RRSARRAYPGMGRTARLCYRSYLNPLMSHCGPDYLDRSACTRRSLVHHEIELPTGRRVDFENLEHAAAEITKGMSHAGGNVTHVVLADDVGLSVHGQRALGALDDVDVVGRGVVMALAARSSRHQPVEMDVDFLGAEARIDQLDLLAPSGLHRARRAFIQMQDFEHARSPHRPCRGNGPHAISFGP